MVYLANEKMPVSGESDAIDTSQREPFEVTVLSA
jgi:hypothetical protein